MPTRFLSDAEIERLERFPEAVDERSLARYFALDADDLRFVRRQHSPAGQLGIALRLCSLRWLGFVPDDLTAAPAEAIAALGAVLDAPPRAIFDYSVRPQTRREHRPLVREHAGFRTGRRAELETLAVSARARAVLDAARGARLSRPRRALGRRRDGLGGWLRLVGGGNHPRVD